MKLVRLVALLVLSGCYNVHYYDSTRAEVASAGERTVLVHTLLGGLISLNDVDSSDYCPGGVKEVHSRIGGVGILAAILTGGIYEPMTVTMTCAAGASK